MNIVVNAAIAINIIIPFQRLEVYRLINCEAKTAPDSENLSPDPYITQAPNPKKLKPKKMVIMYPTLKSNLAEL